MTVSRPADRFVHPALFYRDDREYLAGLAPFITEGLARGEPVAVAVPGDRLAVLSDALGSAVAHVRMIDMTEAGRNPGRIIPGMLHDFVDRHPDTRVRIVGEPIWAGRSDLEYPVCAQHEALINLSFVGRKVTIVCPYHAKDLPPHVLADACATHPLLWDLGTSSVSQQYAPDRVIAAYNRPLTAPPDAPGCTVNFDGDLAFARRFVSRHAHRLGLGHERIADLVLMVNELATNSLAHTDSGCRLRIWRDGDQVVCAAADDGRLSDPLAGRRPTLPGQFGGRGLLLVNELADLVRVHTTPGGTTINVYCRVLPDSPVD